MAKIIYSDLFINKTSKLIAILYDEGYFGFLESSKDYVRQIFDFIETIPSIRFKKTNNAKYGQFFARYQANKRTYYYITFNVIGEVIFIENIFSNYESGYSTFIMGAKK